MYGFRCQGGWKDVWSWCLSSCCVVSHLQFSIHPTQLILTTFINLDFIICSVSPVPAPASAWLEWPRTRPCTNSQLSPLRFIVEHALPAHSLTLDLTKGSRTHKEQNCRNSDNRTWSFAPPAPDRKHPTCRLASCSCPEATLSKCVRYMRSYGRGRCG